MINLLKSLHLFILFFISDALFRRRNLLVRSNRLYGESTVCTVSYSNEFVWVLENLISLSLAKKYWPSLRSMWIGMRDALHAETKSKIHWVLSLKCLVKIPPPVLYKYILVCTQHVSYVRLAADVEEIGLGHQRLARALGPRTARPGTRAVHEGCDREELPSAFEHCCGESTRARMSERACIRSTRGRGGRQM